MTRRLFVDTAPLLYAATAPVADFDSIVSTDADLDAVPGLRRFAPEDFSG